MSTEARFVFTASENTTLMAKFVIRLINGYEWVNLGLPSGLKWELATLVPQAPKITVVTTRGARSRKKSIRPVSK